MEQRQRRMYLLQRLLAETTEQRAIPQEDEAQRNLLRSLMNVRPPRPIDEDFLRVQDEYLKEEARLRGVVSAQTLPAVPGEPRLCLWRGDITRLQIDAIVNAANSALLGCFWPLHGCIDNVIHSQAGVQLRLACHELMARQGHEEPTGQAKLTPGYNLPCRYVLHTVGPIINGPLTEMDRRLLSSCYQSALALAAAHGLRSVAFCCISTGEYRFPPEEAAQIAVATVRAYLAQEPSIERVVFDVYKASDEAIYRRILGL